MGDRDRPLRRAAQSLIDPGPARAHRGDAGLGHRPPRRDRRRDRAADDRARPRQQPGRAAVDQQRLRPRPGRAHPRRRRARRPARTATGLPRRRGMVRARLAAVRPRAEHRDACRRAGPARRRSRPADPRRARHHPEFLPPRGPAVGDRDVGRRVRGRDRDRPLPRRLGPRPPHVALDLRDQRPPLRTRRDPRPARRAGEPGRGVERPLRRRRGGGDGRRPRRTHLAAHRRAGGEGVAARPGGTGGGCRRRRLRRRGAPRSPAARPLRPLPLPRPRRTS